MICTKTRLKHSATPVWGLIIYHQSLKSNVKHQKRLWICTVTQQPWSPPTARPPGFHYTPVTVKVSCEKNCVFWGFSSQYSSVYDISRCQQPLNLPLIRQTNPDLQPVTPLLWLRNVPSRGWTQTFPHWSVSAHSQWLMFLSGINWHTHTHTLIHSFS